MEKDFDDLVYKFYNSKVLHIVQKSFSGPHTSFFCNKIDTQQYEIMSIKSIQFPFSNCVNE